MSISNNTGAKRQDLCPVNMFKSPVVFKWPKRRHWSAVSLLDFLFSFMVPFPKACYFYCICVTS